MFSQYLPSALHQQAANGSSSWREMGDNMKNQGSA